MREYARIQDNRPKKIEQKKPEEKNKKTEVDCDIANNDLTDEYTLL